MKVVPSEQYHLLSNSGTSYTEPSLSRPQQRSVASSSSSSSSTSSSSNGHHSAPHTHHSINRVPAPDECEYDEDARDQRDDEEHYSPFTAYCFTVNYILGVGVLGMPIAFYHGGYFLSSACLFLVTLAAVCTAQWIVDVEARAQIISAKREGRHKSITRIVSNRFEMNELCSLFLGRSLAVIYEIAVSTYLFGSLWSYAAVFAQSVAHYLPATLLCQTMGMACQAHSSLMQNTAESDAQYQAALMLFSVIVVPLTCLQLTEMKLLQVSLALFRFLSLIAMMLTSVHALFSHPLDESSRPPPSSSSHSTPPFLSDISPIEWAGLAVVFPTCIFAQIFHHSVPILSHPVAPHNKPLLPRIFTAVLFTTFALYCLLGITVGLYFGSASHPVCTLNWLSYDGGIPGGTPFTHLIATIIVLFPPLDIVSAYPLNAITLAQNIMTTVLSHDAASPRHDYHRVISTLFRLVASIPAIIGASYIRDLSPILKYTGCVGVIIAFLYPCMLQYASIQAWQEEFADDYYNHTGDNYQVDRHGDVLAYEVAKLDKRHCIATENGGGRQFDASVWFSYSARWLADSMALLGSVFTFSLVGLVVVVGVSITYQAPQHA